MWQCSKCGERVADALAVCRSCGTPHEGIEDHDSRRKDDGDVPKAEAGIITFPTPATAKPPPADSAPLTVPPLPAPPGEQTAEADLYFSFPCPFCQGRLKKGTVTGGNGGGALWLPAGRGFWKRFFGIETIWIPPDGGRCDQCGVIILGKADPPPPPPPQWTVRIRGGQEAKTQMRLVQELLLRRHILPGAAYHAAVLFRRGIRAVVPVPDGEAGRALVKALEGLGLEAEVVAPEIDEGKGPPG
jgi:hypothetical protein